MILEWKHIYLHEAVFTWAVSVVKTSTHNGGLILKLHPLEQCPCTSSTFPVIILQTCLIIKKCLKNVFSDVLI